MRLKEDTTSYKSNGLKRKLKVIPDQPRTHSKKNTRKWCRGKRGVQHDYYLTRCEPASYWFPGEALIVEWRCSQCRKEIFQWLDR